MSESSAYALVQNDFSETTKMSMEEETAFTSVCKAQIVDRRLPSMNTWAPASHEVRVELLELVCKIRFRYFSESRRHPAVLSVSLDRRPFGKLKISNYVGDVCFVIDLVYDNIDLERHDNQLYLITKASGYSDDEKGCVRYWGVQTKSTETYNLPHMGVVRVRNSDVRLTLSSSSSGRWKERKTDRVFFRFRFVLGDSLEAELVSSPVLDAKYLEQGLAICHMNPDKARASLMVESTILCTGASPKCRVFFESEDGSFFQEASILLRHKKFAIVICVPRYPNPSGGRVLVQLRDEDRDSGGEPFLFLPDPLVGQPLEGPMKVKEHLRKRLAKRQILRTDDEEEKDDDLRDVALWLGQGGIDPDDRLLQRLAKSPKAMLATDEKDLTPLALTITSGTLSVAEALLSQIPPRLANDLMKQRLTDLGFTHLLLMAFWPDGEPPLTLLKALLEAGSDLVSLDTDGNSLLHLLIRNEKHATLEAILSSKDQEPFSKISAMLDRANKAGFAPLHEAMHRSQPRAVAALVSAGANINVVSRNSQLTCLHYAALESDAECAVEMTRLLLTGPGLKINERTLEGKTATDIAEERENQKLLDLLKSSGGVNLFEPCSEDEEEEEEETKESGATAATPQPSEEESVSLEEVHQLLLEALSAEHFRALGRDLLSAAENRLLERVVSPGSVFLRLVAAKRRKGEKVELSEALRRLELVELAELMANARVT